MCIEAPFLLTSSPPSPSSPPTHKTNTKELSTEGIIPTPFRFLECDTAVGGDLGQIPEEDYSVAAILGQFPSIFTVAIETKEIGVLSWLFPPNLATDRLYPKEFVQYADADGISFSVPCFIPGEAKRVTRSCPASSAPFVSPLNPDRSETCIKPCPVPAYTDGEYSVMWAISSCIGTLGLGLNSFMACTWVLSGRKAFASIVTQLKACVFFGIMYGLVETLPSLILKYDLPCETVTEEGWGSSQICALNRSGIYMLLAIMINLCVLTLKLFRAIATNEAGRENKKLTAAAIVFPFVLMTLAYVMEGDNDGVDVENTQLNIARYCEFVYVCVCVCVCICCMCVYWRPIPLLLFPKSRVLFFPEEKLPLSGPRLRIPTNPLHPHPLATVFRL
jgi:hypothetical protein